VITHHHMDTLAILVMIILNIHICVACMQAGLAERGFEVVGLNTSPTRHGNNHSGYSHVGCCYAGRLGKAELGGGEEGSTQRTPCECNDHSKHSQGSSAGMQAGLAERAFEVASFNT
jgi:hypothetical protein